MTTLRSLPAVPSAPGLRPAAMGARRPRAAAGLPGYGRLAPRSPRQLTEARGSRADGLVAANQNPYPAAVRGAGICTGPAIRTRLRPPRLAAYREASATLS